MTTSRRIRLGIIGVVLACGAMRTAATVDQWFKTRDLVGNSISGHTPLVAWLVCLVIAPVAAMLVLAARSSYGAHIALAVLAALAVVNDVGEAFWLSSTLHLSGTPWTVTAVAYVPLAVIAWRAAANGRVHPKRPRAVSPAA